MKAEDTQCLIPLTRTIFLSGRKMTYFSVSYFIGNMLSYGVSCNTEGNSFSKSCKMSQILPVFWNSLENTITLALKRVAVLEATQCVQISCSKASAEKQHLSSALLHPSFAIAASEYKIPVNSHYQIVFPLRGNSLSFEKRDISIGNTAFNRQKERYTAMDVL